MKRFSTEELLDEGCSEEFVQLACSVDAEEDESCDQFIQRVEKLIAKLEENETSFSRCVAYGSGLSNAQMKVEVDYDGNALNYFGHSFMNGS